MEARTYTVEIEQLAQGDYSVTVPALPGCFTWGKTLPHAVQMAQDAIQCYVEALLKKGLRIPIENHPTSVLAISVFVPKEA